MKTIRESVSKYIENLPISNTCESNAEEHRQERAFIFGVEFAQRWIPVEEEVPEVNTSSKFCTLYRFSEDVLARAGATYYIAYYCNNSKTWNVKGTSVHNPITHWRPIELK